MTPGDDALSGPGPGSLNLTPVRLRHDRTRGVRETAIGWVLFACAALSALVTAGIIFVLLGETITFFTQVSPLEYLTGTEWTPQFLEQNFGVLPLAAGSTLVAVGAAVVAIPTGLLTAIYMSECARARTRVILKSPHLKSWPGSPRSSTATSL